MLGTVGFVAAAIAFSLYGFSSFKLAEGTNYKRADYLIAYVITATACLTWAISIQVAGNLLGWVIAGDVLLLVASVFMLNSFMTRKLTLPYLLVAGAIISGLLYLRLTSTVSDPVIRSNVLIFNTPRLFGSLLSLALLVIWVRANMRYFDTVVSPRLALLRPSYYSLNLFGFVSVVAFLMARKDITIIIAFTILVTSFVFLTILNYYVKSTLNPHDDKGKQHAF